MRNPHEDGARHLVVTVHGIRTFADWQERLSRLLEAAEPGIQVVNYRYGYFSIFAFIVPMFRWLVTRRFRKELLAWCGGPAEWTRIDIVAHSFGTHLVGWGLYGMAPEVRPRVHTIILSGSVLKKHFPWRDLMRGHVGRVVNECGLHDNVLVANQAIVLLTGMAGRVGFEAMEGVRFRNRFFPFGHSGYYLAGDGTASDDFMREHWVPLLTTESPAPAVDRRRPTSWMDDLTTSLLNNAEPIKLLLYLTPFVLLTLFYYSLFQGERAAREAADARLAQALIARGDADTREGQWERAETTYAEAKALFDDRRWSSLPADLALWQLYRDSPPPLSVTAPYNEGVFTTLALSHGGTVMVTGHSGGAVNVWDMKTGARLRKIAERGDLVSRLAFDAGDSHLQVERVDGTTETIEIASGQPVRQPGPAAARHDDRRPSATGLAVPREIRSPDGRLAMIGAREPVMMDPREQEATSSLKIVALNESGREVRSFPGYADHVTGGAFSDDGRLVVFATRANTLELWTLAPDGDFRWLPGSPGPSATLAVSPEGQWILESGADNSVNVRDLDIDPYLRSLRGHSAPVAGAAFCGNAATAVSGSRDGDVKLWDVVAGRQIRTLGGDRGEVVAIACSSDGRRVVIAEANGVVAAIDATTGAELQRLAAGAGVRNAAFSADGNRAVIGDENGGVGVVELKDGRRHWLATAVGRRSAANVAIAADGKTAVSAHGTEMVLWDLDRRREVRRIRTPREVAHVKMPAGGSWIFSGGSDSRLRVWDAATGQEVRSFLEYPGGLKALHSSTAALRVLSATEYGGRVLWDFARAPQYLDFRRRLPAALERLRAAKSGGPGSRSGGLPADDLALLGQWYAFRGQWKWAAELLDDARSRGASDVSALTLARCYWRAGDSRSARRELERARGAEAALAPLYTAAFRADSNVVQDR